MVRSALDQHTDICCYGELFHGKRAVWYPECEGTTCNKISEWMLSATHKQRVGFAIHLGDDMNAVTREYWRTTSHPKSTQIVYTFRRNQIRQTLSHLRSFAARKLEGGGYMSYPSGSKDHERFGWTAGGLERIGKVTVRCEDFHRRMIRREANEILFFAEQGFYRICPVAYEDFVSDPQRELKQIADFLGVQYESVEPQTVKTGDRPLTELIENYQEFHTYFSRTPYARFLEDD